jgi:hypothetical protein
MAKPPKATPKNLDWGGVSKSVSLLKTSISQKLSGSKTKEIPPEFLQLALKVKNLKKLLEELISLSRHYSKTLMGAADISSSQPLLPHFSLRIEHRTSIVYASYTLSHILFIFFGRPRGLDFSALRI